MGFMNSIYKFLGFESDDVQVVKKKAKQTKASYNLKVTKKLPDEIDGIKVFYPEKFDDCKDKVELLKHETPFFLDLRACNSAEKNKILDYFNGVGDVLGATYEMVEKNLYVFLPKNMQLEKS